METNDLAAELKAANDALLEVGIADIGSLADRIRRLASERDRFINSDVPEYAVVSGAVRPAKK